jgi:hypothetical protein
MLEREGVAFLENGCVDMSRHQTRNEERLDDAYEPPPRDTHSIPLKSHPGGYFRFG